VYISTDNGSNWTQTNNGLTSISFYSLALSGTNIFAGTDNGVYLSTNNGTNWTPVNNSLADVRVNSLTVSGSNIFAGTNGGVYLSTNNGTNWTLVNNGLTSTLVNTLDVSGTNIFAGTIGGSYPWSLSGVYLSTDNGSSWTQVGLPSDYKYITALTVSGTTIYAGAYQLNGSKGVFRSTNNGTDWTQVNNGLPTTSVSCLAISGTNTFAGTDSGVFLSTNDGTSWAQANNGLDNTVNDFAVYGTNVFTSIYGEGVFVSTNSGTNWTQVNNGLTNTNVLSLTVSGTNIFAGTSGAGVWSRALSELPLPVELTSFTANTGNGKINLNWKTATELNNIGFDIERSVNKSVWTKIAHVDGNGNSNSEKNYSYVDKSVSQAGKYYFRLKQIDNNNSYKYSNIVETDLVSPSVFVLNQNYPNPFNPSTTISYRLKEKGFVNLNVYDIKGALIKVLVNEIKEGGYYEMEFDGKGLASGVYIYRIEVIGDGNKPVYSDMKKTVLLK
jgi:hypothetical protein